MSDDQQNSILNDLQIVKKFLGWLTAIGGFSLVAWFGVMISDHFVLHQLREDHAKTQIEVDGMRPRLDRVAWKVYPETGGYQ